MMVTFLRCILRLTFSGTEVSGNCDDYVRFTATAAMVHKLMEAHDEKPLLHFKTQLA
jgi:hypothetical protein